MGSRGGTCHGQHIYGGSAGLPAEVTATTSLGSWRLMKTWAVHEVPARAPPMTEAVVRAMVGWAVTQGHETFGLSLLARALRFVTDRRTFINSSLANTC